ncbi:hypothetical protein [Methanolobus bombayensis]|uniref:hypothetical protein n=1 Tax=Methanolobus bombayensis TaxID=38023 RepID=UPI001AE89E5A|nr:hypothetical protein [Methanolobus bombayensis]MBP1908560.1 hypothetical protein [Methanolobus bombayensis]
MNETNQCNIKNGEVTYTLSLDDRNFLVVTDIGNKKDTLLEYFEKFLGDDCPQFSPAQDISREVFKYIVEPLEQNKPFVFSSGLFYKFGKWATYQANFHSCRGSAASKILKEILGYRISRKDISVHYSDYHPLKTNEIYANLLNHVNTNKNVSIIKK